MDTKKIYIVDDGTLSKEHLEKMFALLKKNGDNNKPIVVDDRPAPLFPPAPPKLKVLNTDESFGSPEQYFRPEPKVQRNEPCHCGSGKKYKNCCMKQG